METLEKSARQKHLDWCKERAAEYIKAGDMSKRPIGRSA